MKRYVFVPPQGSNIHPISESPVPDFINIEEDYFGQAMNMEDALKDMLGIGENPSQEKLQETFCLDLSNDHRKYFALRDYKNKIRLAS
jgi:hypothetical protein